MVTIGTADNIEQASLLKARLEAAGIEAFLADSAVVSLNWMLAGAVGGIKVRVHEADAERARQVLAEDAAEPTDVAPLSPYRCPECGSSMVEFRQLSQTVFLMSLLLLGIPLAFYRPRLHCLACGARWKRDQEQSPAPVPGSDKETSRGDAEPD